MADIRKKDEIKNKCNSIPIDVHQFILFFVGKSINAKLVEFVIFGSWNH